MEGQDFKKNSILADVNVPPMPAIASPGIIYNGKKAIGFDEIDQTIAYPDVRSFRRKFGAKRIGIISLFDKTGSEYAAQMFEDLGFTVVASIGFSCANAVHIAHIPDFAKEQAILNYLATKENRLDAIVQCGTNMSMSQITEKLEPVLNIPILGINAVTFWHALRQTGISDSFAGAGLVGSMHLD